MGQTRRRTPKRLACKLLAIRKRLTVTQPEMAKLLELKVSYTIVSGYERGKQEPDLLVLLKYARLAGVSTDVLIEDKLDLPE